MGWRNIGPHAEITRLVRSRLIRPVDDLPVWSIVCVVVVGSTDAVAGGMPRLVMRRDLP